jgi:hypothetical protein
MGSTRRPLSTMDALEEYIWLALTLVCIGLIAGIAWFVWWGIHFPSSLILSALALALFWSYKRKSAPMARSVQVWMYVLAVIAPPAALALLALNKLEKLGEWLRSEC